MDFSEVVRKRRSIRKYRPENVDQAVLARILDTGTRGPTAGYSQGQSYIVITDPTMIQRLMAEMDRQEQELMGNPPQEEVAEPPAFGAPVLVVACTNEADYHRRYQRPDKVLPDGSEIPWPVPYWYVDSGCGIMLMLLAAVNEGLDACLIGVPFDVAPWRNILGMPDEVMPVGTILIGHRAADEQKRDLRSRRRPQEDYMHRERW
ncbi:MAG TPA: nitroreductase family protein [Ktedonobacterales bacterium]|jgi:nitroreductase|nr:nitroreductase family protein [Ktedonobacterales bacterium]